MISSLKVHQPPPTPGVSRKPTLRRLEHLQYLDLTDCLSLEDAGLKMVVETCPQLLYLFLRRCTSVTGERQNVKIFKKQSSMSQFLTNGKKERESWWFQRPVDFKKSKVQLWKLNLLAASLLTFCCLMSSLAKSSWEKLFFIIAKIIQCYHQSFHHFPNNESRFSLLMRRFLKETFAAAAN